MLRTAIGRANLGTSVETVVYSAGMRIEIQSDNAQSLPLTSYQAKQTIAALVLRAELNPWHKAQPFLLHALLPIYTGYLSKLESSPHFEDIGNLT